VGSRNALRHSLLNVLDNAVKYGPMDQVVRVRVSHSDGRARIEVHDQGPGVPPAERQRIWEPFQRGAGRVVRAAGGSGIGLHLVRELMHAQGGSAQVGDSPHGGACFVLELPCGRGARRGAEAPAPQPAGSV
jgi:signal transduction histidine kinase